MGREGAGRCHATRPRARPSGADILGTIDGANTHIAIRVALKAEIPIMNTGDTDFRRQLERIVALRPEAVITYGNAVESGLILKQLRELGSTAWFLGSDRMVSLEFLELAGDPVDKVAAGYPYDPETDEPRQASFRRDFRERFGDDPETYAAHAYDGMSLVLDAVEKAGLNRARIRDELAAVRSYQGVTGTKELDVVSNNVSPARLAILEQGRFTFHSREDLLE